MPLPVGEDAKLRSPRARASLPNALAQTQPNWPDAPCSRTRWKCGQSGIADEAMPNRPSRFAEHTRNRSTRFASDSRSCRPSRLRWLRQSPNRLRQLRGPNRRDSNRPRGNSRRRPNARGRRASRRHAIACRHRANQAAFLLRGSEPIERRLLRAGPGRHKEVSLLQMR